MNQFKFCLTLISFFSLTLIACNRDQVQATHSIEGTWDIVSITTIKGEFSPSSVNETSRQEETGQLGTFTFGEETVSFEYTRESTLYVGNEDWELTSDKVNDGFTRVRRFDLKIDNQFVFDVRFEDDTKNAENDADNMTFLETPVDSTDRLVIMELEKR